MARTTRIFMVEDNPADVRLIREALQCKGIDSEIEHHETANLGIRALRNFERSEAEVPELILLDYNLPGGTARDILLAMREIPALGPVKKAVLTCSAAPKDREQAFNAGADLFVLKPADLDEFLETVGTAIAGLLADAV